MWRTSSGWLLCLLSGRRVRHCNAVVARVADSSLAFFFFSIFKNNAPRLVLDKVIPCQPNYSYSYSISHFSPNPTWAPSPHRGGCCSPRAEPSLLFLGREYGIRKQGLKKYTVENLCVSDRQYEIYPLSCFRLLLARGKHG